MKYLGKKSLSSFLSVLSQISWYVVLAGSIFTVIWGGILMFTEPVEDPTGSIFAKINYYSFYLIRNDSDLPTLKDLPFFLRMVILPYGIIIMVLLLQILKKSQYIFANFTSNTVFTSNNMNIISQISKLVIWFSILTFNFSSLFVGLILLILCEIFKNGTVLQEEHDLTI